MSLYVGFDCSTQGLTTTVIEVASSQRRIVHNRALEFDRDLPHYLTEHGTLRPDTDPRVVVAPPLMWVESLELAMAQVSRDLGPDIARVRAIAGSDSSTAVCTSVLERR